MSNSFFNKQLFFVLFALIFIAQNGFSESYFIKIHSESKSISIGKMLPINIRKFDKELLIDKVDSTAFHTISEILREKITVSEGSEQLIHIHGMWGGKERFLAENIIDFRDHFLDNDTLNFENLFYILWDSNSNKYCRNFENATKNAPLLSQLFLSLQKAFPETIFTVQTHSMGTQLLTQSIQQTSFEKSPFNNLLFYAPDISKEELQNTHNQLLNLFNNWYIFFHRKDKALKISKRKNGIARIGREPVIDLHEEIEWIDCTDFKAKGLPAKMSKHLHYRSSPETREEILKRMAR